jgi:hypothetical protein
LVMTGLPAKCPDSVAGVTIFKFEAAGKFQQALGAGCVLVRKGKTTW